MKIRFEMKTEFSEKDPHILIQAAQLTDQAREVMEYLEQFSTTNQVVIPIRTDEAAHETSIPPIDETSR